MLSANTAWLVPERDEEAAQRPSLPPCTCDVDQRRPDRRYQVRKDRREGEPDRPPAHVEQVDRQGAGRQAGVQVQRRGRKDAARRERVPGHEQRRLRREQGRVEHQSPDHRAERLVQLDDGDPDHLRECEGRGHLRLTPAFPDYNGLVDERNSGKFDLVINNDKQLGPTPYPFYDYLFHLPVADSQTFANFARFTGAGAAPWALTLDLNEVPREREESEADPTRRSSGTSFRIFLRSHSGTTACGPSTTRRTGRTSRPLPARDCRTRRACGTGTST